MPTKFSQKQIVIIGVVAFLVIGGGLLVFFNLRQSGSSGPTVKLTVWGTESQNVLGPVFAAYPYATIKYTQIDPADYEAQLLSALAAGTGPDVFEIGNRGVPQWKNIIAPLPAAFAQEFGPLQMQSEFPGVVAQDFVSGGQTYALPLYIDTLAMLYNKDLFNSAGIVFPPKTWNDFEADVLKLRVLNSQGQLTQAAAAIGGSEASVPNATDIISLLMLQNGTQMTDSSFTGATFVESGGNSGINAFNFYLQFANAASPYYTWNDGLGTALDNFIQGKSAVLFGYESDLATIKAKAPFLNVGVAAMPQAQGATVSINYPQYQGFVATKAGQVVSAWNLILYLATSPQIESAYVKATGEPPAQLTAIQAALTDPNLTVFAQQALTAKSWHEADDAKINGIFNTAIQDVVNGSENSTQALGQAEASISQLMYQQTLNQ